MDPDFFRNDTIYKGIGWFRVVIWDDFELHENSNRIVVIDNSARFLVRGNV